MTRISLGLLLACVIGLILGCERQAQQGEFPVKSAETNGTSAVAEMPLTADGRAAQQMRAKLDAGDLGAALVQARGLMDSKEVAVRREVVSVFDWVGKKALDELLEMMFDADETVASEAQDAAVNAIETCSFDSEKALILAEIAPKLKTAENADRFFMIFTSMDEKLALKTLPPIIKACAGSGVGEAAREMYEHLAGEPFKEGKTK